MLLEDPHGCIAASAEQCPNIAGGVVVINVRPIGVLIAELAVAHRAGVPLLKPHPVVISLAEAEVRPERSAAPSRFPIFDRLVFAQPVAIAVVAEAVRAVGSVGMARSHLLLVLLAVLAITGVTEALGVNLPARMIAALAGSAEREV
jgi:hypothetical protein